MNFLQVLPESAQALPKPAIEDDDTSLCVAQNLQRLRSKRHLSLDGLARACGVSRAMLAQIESGKSIGLSDWQLLRHVILPQAGILSLPALFANFIFLLKETTVVSAVAVPEILYTTKSYIALYYKTYEMLAVLTLICVLLFLPLSLLLSRLERRLQHGQFGS